MKALIQAVIVSCALATPALSFAQADQSTTTRAQVQQDLQRVEAAGYRPNASDSTYPQDIQAAEAKVSAGEQGQPMEQTAVGGVAQNGSMQMGAPKSTDGHPRSIFFGN
jgi:hypothetical protein